MTNRKMPLGLVVMVALASGLAGCHKDSADEKSGGGAGVSGMEREAQDAALAELQRHWVKGPDGWTTARVSGSPYAPDHYLRQIRELTVDHVHPAELGDSDKLNGFEWAGEVSFKRAPCREAGDSGMVLEGLGDVTVNRPRGQWSQWIDFTPEDLRVQKIKGKWQFTQDTWLLRGNIPTSQDYASARVK